MAGSLTISVSSISAGSFGPSRRSEASELTDMVARYMQVLASSHATSITMKDRTGNTVGTISWTPLNAS